MKEENNFLDRSTIIAIALIGVCWVGWGMYMKKKYPHHYKKPTEQNTQTLKKEKETKPAVLKAVNLKQKIKEKEYQYSAKETDIYISSKGLGLKKVVLNKFLNRDQKPIFFEDLKNPLFRIKTLGTNQEIFFKVKKTAQNKFVGVSSGKDFDIKKTITIDGKDKSLLRVEVEAIQHKKNSLEGLSLHFTSPLPDLEKESGFVSMLNFYTKEFFEAFIVSKEGREHITKKDLEEKKTFFHSSFVGVGGKYFGKAFINKSDILPSTHIEIKSGQAISQIDYKFLHSKPNILKYEIFYGPKSSTELRALSASSTRWVDFGFFSFLARPMLSILIAFYHMFHNWGLAIIALTFFVRLCLLPLNIKSYQSMKVMQKIQPQMQEIRKQFKDKPKEMNQKVLDLMREHKANPFGSFLPILLQFPIFFALYRVLGQSIELYQSPFIFWIQDLSLKDPYFVLPFLAGATFFIQQKITPMNMPPAQARILTFLPIVFSVFMIGLPSGLTLYIFVSGLFGLIQHLFFKQLKES